MTNIKSKPPQKINLQRAVTVNVFEVQGTVALARERPEFLAIAQLAADLKRPIGGNDITRELLGGLPPPVGWLILQRCCGLGLLERTEPDNDKSPAEITELGRNSLKVGKVLVPEEGVWRIYWVEDVLITDAILHVERVETLKARETRDNAKKQQGQLMGGVATPDILFADGMCTSFVDGVKFSLNNMHDKGDAKPLSTLTLYWQWSQEEATPVLYLRGAMDGKKIDSRLNAPKVIQDIGFVELWFSLVEASRNLGSAELRDCFYKTGQLLLPVAFNEKLNKQERNNFKTNLDIPSLELGGIGRFDATKITDIPLYPASEEDVFAWAEWLVQQKISDYQTISTLNTAIDEAIECFPHHQQPKHLNTNYFLQAALKTANDQPYAPRFITAPYDLGQWSIS